MTPSNLQPSTAFIIQYYENRGFMLGPKSLEAMALSYSEI